MGNEVKIIHTADIHLGASFSYLTPSQRAKRQSELIITTENIFKLCKANTVDFLLLCGDVFENNSVDDATIKAFFACFSLCPETSVIYAAGNHDPLTANSPFLKERLPDNLYILDKHDACLKFQNKGVNIYGKSFSSAYMSGSQGFSLPTDSDTVNIMVIHGDTQSDMSGVYNPITKDFIKNSNMDYIALGHIHEFSGVNSIGKTHYAYSGCPEPHGFDELGAKGIVCANIGKDSFEYSFVPVSVRRHEEVYVDLTDMCDSASVADKIIGTLQKQFGDKYSENLYKIILSGSVDEEYRVNTNEILRRVSDYVFYAKIKDKTEIKINLELLAKENSFKGKFVKIMLDKIAVAQDDDVPKLRQALFVGLKAFSGEVKYSENQ